MDLKSLAEKVLSYSPVVASAIAGPAGGMVASLLASVFGVSTDQLAAQISTDPNAAVKIKQFELDNSLELAKVSLQSYQAEIGDIENARLTNTQNDKYPWFIHTLSIIITFGFFVAIGLIAFTKGDNSDHDILNMMIGVLGTTFVSVVSYYFGKSQNNN